MKMVRSAGKHTIRKFTVVLLSFACLLGAALIVDFLWASLSSSSSAAYLSISSNWAPERSHIVVIPNVTNKSEKMVDVKKKEGVAQRFLSSDIC
ncbi:hypothetical protein F0562_004535 [Nyssa sinensis]|uniref:Uncharacterized protein n=1 Tax=Nyssa sinensis TaxID=561372 RepID=A0A5J5BZZ0_9ASTE|nr:hypothetical protein F0562_004535 [Nyssa sinensis]